MRTDITNNALMALEVDIQNQVKASPAFYYFNKEKLKRFYQQNGHLLRIINDRMAEYIKKYVVHEDEKPVTEKKDEGEVYVFTSTEAEEKYRAETAEFLNRTVKIEL